MDLASSDLHDWYKQNRYLSQDDWPPYHPNHYTPLTIICHEGRCTEHEIKTVAQWSMLKDMESGRPYSDILDSAVKSISELFARFEQATPYMILIEGAPGTGKTALSKEIAYQWANQNILKDKKLFFLLFLRDPEVKEITDIQSLVKYFIESDSVASKVTNWLKETGGKYLNILLDGYDEAFASDDKSHFILNKIIGRKELKTCGLIITSRPVASSHLHNVVNCRAEVLGFTEKEQHDFLQSAFKGDKDKIKQIKDFLYSNPFLSTLLNIPLNMRILLCLMEDGINAVPNSQTELYDRFTMMTIVHHLKKRNIVKDADFTSLDGLPTPFDQMVKELSQFAFVALEKDQLVFTKADITTICSNVTPANWDDLGLLKPAKYFRPQDVRDHKSFHFLHFAIQEYMAAYYIASLPDSKQLSLLNTTFWDVLYFNTWVMYVGITGGKKSSFKHFLSGNPFPSLFSWFLRSSDISSEFLNDKIKCLYLLRCLTETNFDHEMLSSIRKIFQDDSIDLSNQPLSNSDVFTLAVLLQSFPGKQWEKLDLSGCYIDSQSCNSFCEKLQQHKGVPFKIKCVDISNRHKHSGNKLYFESLYKFCQILRFWHTKKLILSVESLYDREARNEIRHFTNEINKTISCRSQFLTDEPCSLLLVTYMAEQNKMTAVYSNKTFIQCIVFSAYAMVEELTYFFKKLRVEVVDDVLFSYNITKRHASILKSSLSLFESVQLYGVNVHSTGTYLLHNNAIVESFYCSKHAPIADYLSAVVCHNLCTSESYLGSLSSRHVTSLKQTLQNSSNLEIFNIANNSINSKAAADIATVLHHCTKIKELHLNRNTMEAKGITEITKALKNISSLREFNISSNNISFMAACDVSELLYHNTNLTSLNLGVNNLQNEGAIIITEGLKHTLTLESFDISNNNITDVASANHIASVLCNNPKLLKFNFIGNNLQAEGLNVIAKALQRISTLEVFNISNNNLSIDVANSIADLLSSNNKLQELYLGSNHVHTRSATAIAKGLHNTSTLTIFNMSNNHISFDAASGIVDALSNNPKLKELDLSSNNLQASGAITIAKNLKNIISNLTVFNMSGNKITVEASSFIAQFLSYNAKLQELYLAKNNLQTTGIVNIARIIKGISYLTVLDISYNQIDADAATDIAAIVKHNCKLQTLSLAGNNLQAQGIAKISIALQKITSLLLLDISSNKINADAAPDIAAAFSFNTMLRKLNISRNELKADGIITIARTLKDLSTMLIFDISNNVISTEAASEIATLLSHNSKLQELYLNETDLQTEGATQIAQGLKHTSTLTVFSVSNNCFSYEAVRYIASAISHNNDLQELRLDGNNLQAKGVIEIAKSLKSTKSLTVFSISNNSINTEAADEIAAVLSHNIKLQELYLHGNNLQTRGAIKIAQGLKCTLTLTKLNISGNNISFEAANEIAAVLSGSTKLEELHLGDNDFQTEGAIIIALGLKSISTLMICNIPNNSISVKAADTIAHALSHNTKLQELYLDGNNLYGEGALKIAKSLKEISTLKTFNISGNGISINEEHDIAAVLRHNTKLDLHFADGKTDVAD